jgi:predicted acylesterase/phospholipase RssA/CRP-like cAMP-binding protein
LAKGKMAAISIIKRYTLIRKFPTFSQLSWLDQQRIALKSYLVEYRKGEVIRQQGDPPDALYCLLSGRVHAYLTETTGKKIQVDLFRRGMYFGIISLLTGQNHSLSFVAVNDSVVLKIDREQFQEILNTIPKLGIEFSQSLSQRIRRRIVQGEAMSFGSIIAIYSPVKGSGCSAYAFNLGLALQHESHKRVLLVNVNPVRCDHGHNIPSQKATPHWKCPPVALNELLNNQDKLRNFIISGRLAIDLLNVSFQPEDPTNVDVISDFVTLLEQYYHYVVVDLPNEMNNVVMKTLSQADLVQVVTNISDETNFTSARQIIHDLEEEVKGNYSVEKVQVLVTQMAEESTLSYEEINQRIDYDVYKKLPRIDLTHLINQLVCEELEVFVPDKDSPYTREVTVIARRISGVQIGLVLGGGAALGLAHIGVLRVLEQENIPIDIVVGSSMGALIGSLWATGLNSSQIADLAREFRNQNALLKLFDPVIPKSGIIKGKMISRWLRTRHLGEKTFYNTNIPLKIVAYDLVHRQELVIGSGSLVDAVRKSISIPGILEPVLEKDQVIIDGGVLNPLPTNVLKNAGINKIIAVNVLQSPEDITLGYLTEQRHQLNKRNVPFRENPLLCTQDWFKKQLKKSLTPNISDIIVQSLLASEYVIAEQSGELASVLIHPNLYDAAWYEFYKVDHLIQKGEEAARSLLPEIKRLCLE